MNELHDDRLDLIGLALRLPQNRALLAGPNITINAMIPFYAASPSLFSRRAASMSPRRIVVALTCGSALAATATAALGAEPVAQIAPESVATTLAAQVRPGTGGSAAPLQGVLQNAERTQNADALLLAYGEAVRDSDQARAAIGLLLANYYALRNQAQTAEQAIQAVAEASLRFQVFQAAQNQVLIQQNQLMLEQNAQLIRIMSERAAPTRAPAPAPRR